MGADIGWVLGKGDDAVVVRGTGPRETSKQNAQAKLGSTLLLLVSGMLFYSPLLQPMWLVVCWVG